MPLRFLLDEHLRGAPWDIIQRHNLSGADPIDAVRVGDPADLPLGSDDPQLLRWAERQQRILLSEDKSTLPTHLSDHLAGGGHSPGIMIVRAGTSFPALLSFLVLAAYVTEPSEWEDQLVYIPL